MKKILSSLTIIGLTLALATGFSRAFFSDIETSKGNTLTAGKIDLLIDNTSYYNGQPNSDTTWTSDNLPGHLFFNFNDIKPSDWGEDTISLKVNDNDSWACMKVNLTADDDNTCTDPEDDQGNDPSCSEPDTDLFDGELGKHLTFIFWADDGDNVLETNEVEKIFKKGKPQDLFNASNWVLSDSIFNVWQTTPAPLAGAQTYYIGKAWCFGNLGLNPVTSGQGVNPTINSGVTCDGSNLNNASQTDILKADVEFFAVQFRNNPQFRCDRRWDPVGEYEITYTCTSGCSGTYSHHLDISSYDYPTGNMAGNGYYITDSAYTWHTTSGSVIGSAFNLSLIYDGLNPGYTVNLTGTIQNDGTISGTAASSTGQNFTWVTTNGTVSEIY